MSEWIDIIKSFLADNWLWLLLAMLLLYHIHNYVMLLVSVAVFPLTAVGASIWDLSKKVVWPEDEDNRMSPRNFFFFLAGSLAFFIEIYLFYLFLDYYLLGDSVIPLFGKWGFEMAMLSAIAFGMLALIFGHLAHHILTTSKKKSERIVGWAAAIFFVIAALVLGYSGGLRAYTLGWASQVSGLVIGFSVAIGAIFGFMMPFGAVVGMSRGGFMWHLFRNLLLGIPLTIGLFMLIIAAFVFFLVEITLTLFSLPIRQLAIVIGGFCGIRPNRQKTDELTGWRVGMNHLLSHAEPPERLSHFLETTRKKINFWEEEKVAKPKRQNKQSSPTTTTQQPQQEEEQPTQQPEPKYKKIDLPPTPNSN